jgi:hypothetical protein
MRLSEPAQVDYPKTASCRLPRTGAVIAYCPKGQWRAGSRGANMTTHKYMQVHSDCREIRPVSDLGEAAEGACEVNPFGIAHAI